MTVIHLPNGPTAYFKLTNLTLSKEIPVSRFFFIITDNKFILNWIFFNDKKNKQTINNIEN